jgi:hypothetical protein
LRDDQQLIIVVEHCMLQRPSRNGFGGSHDKYVSTYSTLVELASETCCVGCHHGGFLALENPPRARWPPMDRRVLTRWQLSHLERSKPVAKKPTALINGYSPVTSRLSETDVGVASEPSWQWTSPRIGSFEVVFSLLSAGKVRKLAHL